MASPNVSPARAMLAGLRARSNVPGSRPPLFCATVRLGRAPATTALWQVPVSALCPTLPDELIESASDAAAASSLRMGWDARAVDDDERWSLCGATAILRAQGWDRVSTLERKTALLWARIGCVETDRSMSPAPRPRLFGGLSFTPDDGRGDDLWAPWGDGLLVLPRWALIQRSDGAWLMWTGRAIELHGTAIDAEVDAVDNAIAGTPKRLSKNGARSTERPSQPSRCGGSGLSYIDTVQSALSKIEAGELGKVVVARRKEAELPSPLGPDDIWARLDHAPTTTSRFCLSWLGLTFFGATPELLISSDGTRLQTVALAGTQHLTADREPAGDVRERWSDKDLREHRWVIDGIAHRLVAEGLDPVVAATDELTAGPVVHLRTTIEASSRTPSVLALVGALHPTPALCGTPTAAARAFIVANEPARGYYAAPLGWVDPRGRGCFVVCIRSGLLRGQEAFAFAGAGIVAGSVPEQELAETEAKLRIALDTLGAP